VTGFNQIEVESIANALGDTETGLSGSEIGHLLHTLKMPDPTPQITKRHRLLNAFAEDQNTRKDRTGILAFMRRAMKPARWLNKKEGYEPLRTKLNEALALAGLQMDAAGTIADAAAVSTISAAEQRARDLRGIMVKRQVHPDVLHFCNAELLTDNYFHAVLEAVKSVFDKMRSRAGLLEDGGELVQRVFGGETPLLAINPRQIKSQKDEQKGFANLLVGTFGMFRNPAAHEAKIKWEMTLEDAEDLLSLVSLIHRRIDGSTMPPRV